MLLCPEYHFQKLDPELNRQLCSERTFDLGRRLWIVNHHARRSRLLTLPGPPRIRNGGARNLDKIRPLISRERPAATILQRADT
jgi:hypothetical protein